MVAEVTLGVRRPSTKSGKKWALEKVKLYLTRLALIGGVPPLSGVKEPVPIRHRVPLVTFDTVV